MMAEEVIHPFLAMIQRVRSLQWMAGSVIMTATSPVEKIFPLVPFEKQIKSEAADPRVQESRKLEESTDRPFIDVSSSDGQPMSGLVKKCTYCRSDLEDSAETGAKPSVHCERCKKNEQKYGKPSICKYCQLPAAFHEGKCVYCAHSERRNGEPLICAQCKLRAYFDYQGKKKPGLCRMCINNARTQKLSTLAGVKVPSHEVPPSRPKDKRPKRKSLSEAAPAPKLPKTMPIDSGEHVLQVQQLKDKIAELQEALRNKDQQIIEKEKKIAGLKAELMSNERKANEKYERLKKDHEKTIYAVHEKYKGERMAAAAAKAASAGGKN